jgi:hypothetical protein
VLPLAELMFLALKKLKFAKQQENTWDCALPNALMDKHTVVPVLSVTRSLESVHQPPATLQKELLLLALHTWNAVPILLSVFTLHVTKKTSLKPASTKLLNMVTMLASSQMVNLRENAPLVPLPYLVLRETAPMATNVTPNLELATLTALLTQIALSIYDVRALYVSKQPAQLKLTAQITLLVCLMLVMKIQHAQMAQSVLIKNAPKECAKFATLMTSAKLMEPTDQPAFSTITLQSMGITWSAPVTMSIANMTLQLILVCAPRAPLKETNIKNALLEVHAFPHLAPLVPIATQEFVAILALLTQACASPVVPIASARSKLMAPKTLLLCAVTELAVCRAAKTMLNATLNFAPQSILKSTPRTRLPTNAPCACMAVKSNSPMVLTKKLSVMFQKTLLEAQTWENASMETAHTDSRTILKE